MAAAAGADKPRALVLAPMRGPAYDELCAMYDVTYDPFIDHQPLKLHSPDELRDRLVELGATLVVSEADKIAGAALDTPVQIIGSTRGDPTNVDIPAATAKGIPVLRAPGRNADAVAEMTLALLFAANRGVVPADKDVRAGQMYKDGTIPYQRYRAWQLAGQTIGIVGFGAIGRALAWRCEGLGMRVVSFDPYAPDATHTDLGALLAESDVVTMHAPVTPETTGMIGKDEFAAMKQGAVYLNAARAALHDQDALVASLESGHLGAAGLDHFPNEWLDPASALAQMPNVVLTPHVGGATYDTEANHSRMIVDGIKAIQAGEVPANCVNPEVLAK